MAAGHCFAGQQCYDETLRLVAFNDRSIRFSNFWNIWFPTWEMLSPYCSIIAWTVYKYHLILTFYVNIAFLVTEKGWQSAAENSIIKFLSRSVSTYFIKPYVCMDKALAWVCVIGIYIHKFTSDKAREIEHCTKITIIEELIFSRANDSISWSYAPLQSTKCTVSHLLRVGCRREDMGVVSVYTSFHVWHAYIYSWLSHCFCWKFCGVCWFSESACR